MGKTKASDKEGSGKEKEVNNWSLCSSCGRVFFTFGAEKVDICVNCL